jgi:hypothetical protein
MIDGSYKKRILFQDFEVRGAKLAFSKVIHKLINERFYINKRRERNWDFDTCGTAALSLLTGIVPRIVERQLPKNKVHWSDQAVTQFLTTRGYSICQVSKCGVTNLDARAEWELMPINKNHVLLCNLLMCVDEASWWVIHDGFSFHNFEMRELNPLLLLNKPSQSVYLVAHDKWK